MNGRDWNPYMESWAYPWGVNDPREFGRGTVRDRDTTTPEPDDAEDPGALEDPGDEERT